MDVDSKWCSPPVKPALKNINPPLPTILITTYQAPALYGYDARRPVIYADIIRCECGGGCQASISREEYYPGMPHYRYFRVSVHFMEVFLVQTRTALTGERSSLFGFYACVVAVAEVMLVESLPSVGRGY